MSISVVIGTYGSSKWKRAAQVAALTVPSECEIILSHKDTLHEARNSGAIKASGKRLVFLDADDELTPDFAKLIVEDEDVLQPKTVYVSPEGQRGEPSWLTPCQSLLHGNHLIVGCPVIREAFLEVGGFDRWPVYEDWALWLKMQRAGATFGKTEAVYVVNVNPKGRNSHIDARSHAQRIQRRYA